MLNNIGRKLLVFRGQGSKDKRSGIHYVGKLNNRETAIKSIKTFEEDHIAVANMGSGNINEYRRSVFGLPIPIASKDSYKSKYDVTYFDIKTNRFDNQARRASPMFIHIHKMDGKFHGYIFLLPAEFLPPEHSLALKGGHHKMHKIEKPVITRCY